MEVIIAKGINIVFIDEFGVNESSYKPYSWGNSGKENFIL